MKKVLAKKLEYLKKILAEKKKIAIAFSGGVDSTFLLKVAADVLKSNVVALTACSPFMTSDELCFTQEFCKKNGIEQIFFELAPFENSEICENGSRRCYFCKKEIFLNFKNLAAQKKIEFVAEGSNCDDLGDFRPGMQAVKELSVLQPLVESGLTKNEIRILSHKMKLKSWNKPSLACLASRIPYGEKITSEKIEAVRKGEKFLSDLGIRQKRVRFFECEKIKVAKIEVGVKDFKKICRHKKNIDVALKDFGFDFVALDLAPFKSGSLNKGV